MQNGLVTRRMGVPEFLSFREILGEFYSQRLNERKQTVYESSKTSFTLDGCYLGTRVSSVLATGDETAISEIRRKIIACALQESISRPVTLYRE